MDPPISLARMHLNCASCTGIVCLSGWVWYPGTGKTTIALAAAKACDATITVLNGAEVKKALRKANKKIINRFKLSAALFPFPSFKIFNRVSRQAPVFLPGSCVCVLGLS